MGLRQVVPGGTPWVVGVLCTGAVRSGLLGPCGGDALSAPALPISGHGSSVRVVLFLSFGVQPLRGSTHALASPRRLATWSRHREPVARECPTICSFPTTLSSPLSLSLSAACGEACGTVSSTIRCGQAYPNFTCHCWTRGDGSLVRGHACRARARRKRIWSGTEASARQFGSSTCGACSVMPSEHRALHASSRRPPRHHHADVCHWHR